VKIVTTGVGNGNVTQVALNIPGARVKKDILCLFSRVTTGWVSRDVPGSGDRYGRRKEETG
jgi:hypothetical protein